MRFGAFGGNIKIITGKCARCGKDSEFSERQYIEGKSICRECHIFVTNVDRIEEQLLEQEFSIEKTDADLARQINEALVRESSGASEKDEELLTSLIERLFQDAKRRKKIIKEIRSLQKKKK